MAPETRPKGNPPPSRVYHSSPTLYQTHLPDQKRRIGKTYSRRFTAARTLHQQTLTQMTFVSSSARDTEEAEGEEPGLDGDSEEGRAGMKGGRPGKARRNTTGPGGARRRKTTGDEAGGDSESVGSSRHHTQTLTQLLHGSRAALKDGEGKETRLPPEMIVIEDSEAEDDDSDFDAGQEVVDVDTTRDADTELTTDHDTDSKREQPQQQPQEKPEQQERQEQPQVTRPSSAKRLKQDADPHTPSTKRQRLEVPSAVPLVGSPLTPMLKRYGPLQTKPSPLKYKSPNVSSLPIKSVDLQELPAGLKPKLEAGAQNPNATDLSEKPPVNNPRRAFIEIPDSQDDQEDGGLDSDDEVVVGEDLAALEERVLGAPRTTSINKGFALYTSHASKRETDATINVSSVQAQAQAQAQVQGANSEAESCTESGDEDKENVDENAHAHGHEYETHYHTGMETQAVLEQAFERSERERTALSSIRPSQLTHSSRGLSSFTTATTAPTPANAVSGYAWTRRRTKHPPPPEFQTQFESQRVSLDTIRGMKPPNRRSDLWVAMKPETVAQIVAGAKTHDFRSWLNPEVQRFWLFESRPTCQLRYMADVGPRQEPGAVDERGLGNKEFNARRSAPYAHELVQVYELNDPVPLQEMIDCGWVDAAPERQNEYVPPAIVARLLANLRWALFAEGDDEEGEEDEWEEEGEEVEAEAEAEPEVEVYDGSAADHALSSSPIRNENGSKRPAARRRGPKGLARGALTSISAEGPLYSALEAVPGLPLATVPATSSPILGSKLLRRPSPPQPRTPTSKSNRSPDYYAIINFRTPLRPISRQSQISTSSGGTTASQLTPKIRGAATGRDNDPDDDDDDVEIPSPTPRRPRRPTHESSNLTALLRSTHGTASSDPVIESPRPAVLSSSQALPDSLVREDGRKPPVVVWDSQEEEEEDLNHDYYTGGAGSDIYDESGYDDEL